MSAEQLNFETATYNLPEQFVMVLGLAKRGSNARSTWVVTYVNSDGEWLSGEEILKWSYLPNKNLLTY